MKKQIFPTILTTIAAALTLSAMPVVGETALTLPYGAANVLKLAQANVGEETIVAYIEKTGHGYNLGANEIIYLRDQGVTDRVVSAMLTQEKKTRDAAAAQAAAEQLVAATPPAPAPAAPVAAPQYQQAYTPPPVTYVQPAPAPLIVMRDSSPRLTDYGIYPRYGYSYCGYPSYGYRSYGYSPSVSFSFGYGYGGGYCGSGYRGGYGYYGGHGSKHCR